MYAALRTLLAGSVPGAPFPGLNPGDVAIGPAIGEVVSAPAASGLQPGGLVVHMLGWREYAVVDAAACEPVDGDLPDPPAYLAQGTTAYAAVVIRGSAPLADQLAKAAPDGLDGTGKPAPGPRGSCSTGSRRWTPRSPGSPSCGTSSRPASSPRSARSWPPDQVSNAGSHPG